MQDNIDTLVAAALAKMVRMDSVARATEEAKVAKATKAPKVAKATKATKVPKEPVAKAITGKQGTNDCGFPVWRGVRATGPGFVAGSAGSDAEYWKMRQGIAALVAAIFDEAQGHNDLAQGAEVLAKEASEAGDLEMSAIYAEEAVTERGMFAVKLDLSRQIERELRLDDREAIVRRYRASGSFGQVTERTIACDVGSLGKASLDDDNGGVVVEAGDAYVLPALTEAEERAVRCAKASGAHDSFNRITGDNFKE